LFSIPIFMLLPAAVAHLFGATVLSPRHRGTLWSFAIYGAAAFLSAFFFTGVFEEVGWRGFLLPRLQRKFSPLVASLLVWLPWALWHAPLDVTRFRLHMWTWANYMQVRVIFLIPLAIIFTWLYNRSGGNVLACSIFHAGADVFPIFLPFAPKMRAVIFVWAACVVIADRMWRVKKDRDTLG